MTTTTVVNVQRNSKGLVDALFDSIDKLNKKEIDAEHARALSHTARTIVQIANMELEIRKHQQEKHIDGEVVKSLSVDNGK